MSEKCFTRNPLVRDGTNQTQRVLQTLLPAYVAVDERSMKDLTEFASKFSSEVQFYDDTNTPAGDWESFFNLTTDWAKFSLKDYLEALKIDQQEKPHLALFFGFLYMFKVAQDDMNTITKRHLDFYYREVLRLKENPAVPDQVAIIFKLAKHVDSYQIKEGTKLKAGKDDNGVELIYKVDKDVAINTASIEELKAIYADTTYGDKIGDNRLYASRIANSSDGKGGDIENEEKSWETFGKDNPISDRDFGEIGFAIASPLLNLAEGKRVVTLTFSLKKVSVDRLFDADKIQVYFSGEKEWILSKEFTKGTLAPTHLDSNNNELVIRREISADQDPILPFNSEEFSDRIKTKWPVVKVVLNQAGTESDVYKLLIDLEPKNVVVNVDVTGVQNLILQNDQATLDASKPFQPFGNRPHIGSNFYIGSWEVFQKELSTLNIELKWKDLPDNGDGFKDYYVNYLDSPNGIERANDKFKIAIKILEKKAWNQVVSATELFTDEAGDKLLDSEQLPNADSPNSLIKVDGIVDKVEMDEELEKFESLDNNSVKGFLRLILKDEDFGHKSYPNSYANQAIELAKYEEPPPAELGEILANPGTENNVGVTAIDGLLYAQGAPILPNEPYTPTIETLSLNYTAEVTIDLKSQTAVEFNKDVDQYFYIHPFGANRLDTTGDHEDFPDTIDNPNPKNYLLPQYNNEGNLYIGIDNLKPPQTLSVLFQCAEGSDNPEANQQKVTWSYLKNNYWIELDSNKQILSDATNGLLNSGIIQFDFPKDMSSNNSLLPDKRFWVRATVVEEADAVCDLIDVKAQAVLAVFADQGNDPDHLRTALEAGTISKLKISDSSIDKLEQPYSSFGGQIAEQSPDFYTRVSERLRHKHRAITIWDYEHLILQKFPDVYKVKCINHTLYDGELTTYSEMAAGHVTLIVISNVFNKNAVDPLRPKTSLANLSAIDEYIKGINPPCAEIHVKNPIYEEIKVKFDVKFNKGVDAGLHSEKLNQEIKDFLSPWASDCPTDIRFGGKIHKSMIINFVEERSYVDYVTCFKMYHTTDPNNPSSVDVEEVIATKAITILGSGNNHDVNPIDANVEECICDDNNVQSVAQMASVDTCTSNSSGISPEHECSEENIQI